MGKSRKKSPFFANTGAESEKKDKRFANRKLRRAVDKELDKVKENPELAEEVALPEMREVSDEWKFDKDGKRYWNPPVEPPHEPDVLQELKDEKIVNKPRYWHLTDYERQQKLMRK